MEAGRGIRAEKVKALKDEEDPGPDRSRDPSSDLDPRDREVVKEGREIEEDPLGRFPQSGPVPGGRLPESEMEKRFSRFSKSMEKLDVEEKRVVEEYYRRLRDIR